MILKQDPNAPHIKSFRDHKPPPSGVPSRIELEPRMKSPFQVRSDYPNHNFWLSRRVEPAIAALDSVDGYVGRTLSVTDTKLYMEEAIGNNQKLPLFLGEMESDYTEEKCRGLFRQLCLNVLILHRVHVAHRNLHLNNILVHPTTVRGINGD